MDMNFDIVREYERTRLVITEFDSGDVIATSGALLGPSLDKYEGIPIVED